MICITLRILINNDIIYDVLNAIIILTMIIIVIIFICEYYYYYYHYRCCFREIVAYMHAGFGHKILRLTTWS